MTDYLQHNPTACIAAISLALVVLAFAFFKLEQKIKRNYKRFEQDEDDIDFNEYQ